MAETEKQQLQWEEYWSETKSIAQSSYPEARPIWDNDAEYAAGSDIPRFKSLVDPSLPIVDFGCGNGTQAALLAKHFGRVIGTDVAQSAVVLAAQANPGPNLSYEVLDALSLTDMQKFHDRFGDLNLYVRTVAHQFGPDERLILGRGLRTLMGERGTTYIVELGPRSPEYFQNWIQTNGMPRKLMRIVSKGIQPGPVGRADIDNMFPKSEFEVLSEGECTIPNALMSSDKLDAEGKPEGAVWEPPMYYAVVRKKHTKN
jgi:SAM-dependent methyltransferase